MTAVRRTHFLFLNVGHAYDHLFMLVFATAVLRLERDWAMGYDALLPLATGGFVAFAAGSIPAGWLGDRWSRTGMMAVFFLGIGVAAMLTGLAQTPFQLACGLTLIGLFAAIYHPVGIALVVSGADRVGSALGVNGVWGNLGVAFAALIAGALSDLWSWRAAFILPGAVAVATGLAYLALRSRFEAALAGASGARARHKVVPLGRADLMRVLFVLAVATVIGGVIFNATTIGLPKAFDERLGGLVQSALGVGGLAAAVYTAAAFAQVVVGRLIDRYPMKPIFFAVTALQAPLLWLCAMLTGAPMLLCAFLLMLVVFGQIPINDALIARHTPEAWRSRVYAVKYVSTLGVSAAAPLLIAYAYAETGSSTALFGALAWGAAGIAAAVLMLPGPRPAAAPDASPAAPASRAA
jgi:MFS family permease